MKNQKIIESWNKIEPNTGAKERMLDSILEDNQSGLRQKTRASALKWALPLAAVAVLGFVVMMPLLKSEKVDFVLEGSKGVTVRYIKDPPAVNHNQDKTSLVWLEEDELLASHFNGSEIVIFEGMVSEVRNIVCDFDWTKAYMAIAWITVQDSLRGNLMPGSTVTVLLPGPVGNEMRQEDTGISFRLRAGVSGVFMPVRYDENALYSVGDNSLALMDLAEFGLPDGMRWMFLQIGQDLVYERGSYPSFTGSRNLGDVKAVISAKLNLNESGIE